jgi:anti-sigma factor RsiW
MMPPEHPFLPGQSPDDETLLAYAEGRLSPEQTHAVEQWLATETPESEAIEGLQLLESQTTRALQKRINSRVALSTRRNRRERRQQPISQRWVMTAVVTILGLLLLAALYFFVFRNAK